MNVQHLRVSVLAAVLLAGCTCCSLKPATVFGPLPNEKIAQALRDKPLAATENFKVTLLDTDTASSYHLAQIRHEERLHRHNTHDAKVLLWKGKGTLLLNGKSIPLKEGDEIKIPRGVPHAFINEAEVPTVAVVQFTPRFDGKDTEYL